MIVFTTVLSFLLDGIISKYISTNTIFLPLLTIMSLIIIYPYFKEPYKYFKYCSILGILYDIAYTNTIFYNFFIFIILGFIITFFYYIFSNRLLNTIILGFIVIILYKLINYLFILIFINNKLTFKVLYTNIYSSLLVNIIFLILGYILTKYYSKRHKLLRIN
ncbi:MAG: hypothetical protein E7170_03990 [Firmicutes bacterium]|nr:hypothetical protein [Bacillota bacterium]